MRPHARWDWLVWALVVYAFCWWGAERCHAQALPAVATALIAEDVTQTLFWQSVAGCAYCVEANPILGARPAAQTVLAWGVACVGVQWLLPARARRVVNLITIGAEVAAVTFNARQRLPSGRLVGLRVP